jgi:OmpA-OmpF porin, OOP family
MRTFFAFAAAILGLAVVLPAPVQAQNPSSESIIQSLKPTGGATTRGIRPVAPDVGAAPATPGPTTGARPSRPHGAASATPATPPAAAGGEQPSVNLTVQFRTGSSDLTASATRTLDELGHALSSPSLAGFHFRIEGHTDTVGNPERNKALSQRRAETVVDYLVNKFSVDRNKLEAVGMGEEGLLVPTPPQTAEPRNRRVTVVNVGT